MCMSHRAIDILVRMLRTSGYSLRPTGSSPWRPDSGLFVIGSTDAWQTGRGVSEPDRWEHGSTLAWPWPDTVPLTAGPPLHPWGSSDLHTGSGRQALALLAEMGMRTRGWRRIL